MLLLFLSTHLSHIKNFIRVIFPTITLLKHDFWFLCISTNFLIVYIRCLSNYSFYWKKLDIYWKKLLWFHFLAFGFPSFFKDVFIELPLILQSYFIFVYCISFISFVIQFVVKFLEYFFPFLSHHFWFILTLHPSVNLHRSYIFQCF